MPWAQRDGRLLIATAEPGPETVLFARRLWGRDIEFVVASKFDIIWSVQTAFADALSRHAVFDLAEQDPDMSARTVMTPSQAVICYALLSLLLGGSRLRADRDADRAQRRAQRRSISAISCSAACWSRPAAAARPNGTTKSRSPRARLREDELPVFTVLVPMFREGKVLPKLAQSLRALDYPLGKLDIKIVLEDDDTETIEAARQLGLEGVFEVIRVPPSQPQTKPKACNFALRFARGKYVVVYDAEDQPEPDQLRKVVATFQHAAAGSRLPAMPAELLQCR